MNIQVTVFAVYFAVVFGIGWYSLRKTTDESDYWIAGGKLGWMVGGATLAATHTSAGTFIGTIGVIHTVGWSFGWLILTIPLAYWFMVAVLAPRFTRVRKLTLPDFIEARYDSKVARAIAAAIILVAATVYIQAQIVAGGIIGNIVFGIPNTHGMVIFTLILLAYTVVGGMIAVAYTDFLQLVIMFLGALISVPLALRHLGGFTDLLGYVQAIKPITFTWEGLPLTLLFTMSLAFMLGSIATPEKLIRLYAMKDMRTIRRGVLFTIVMATLMNFMVAILALASIAFFPNLPTGDLAMPLVARAVLPAFIGSLMLAGITSAMMSTVDSLLIVAGSALSEDIYGILFDPEASHKRRLFIARLGILIVGTVPLILTLSGVAEGELVQFIVLLFTALMASSFFMPVVGGVLWRRANKQGAIAAMVGGITVSSLWELFGATHIDPVLPGFLCSAILFVTVSWLAPAPPTSAVSLYFDEKGKGGG
ncbi:sodium:solute symporter [Gemmatimonadota bacterium]